MATRKEFVAEEVTRAVGAGKAVAMETVDFNDPNTCRSLGEDYGASVTHQKQERRKINFAFSLRNLNVNVSNFSLSL